LEVGFGAGLFTASPFVFYQLWLFIVPGLYRKEKRHVLPFLLGTVGLFIAGGFIGYKIVHPGIAGYPKRTRPALPADDYDCRIYEVVSDNHHWPRADLRNADPRVLSRLDAGDYARWMWRSLRQSILAIVVVAAMVTPTTDILNMCLFAAPMVALYGIGIGLAWLVNSTRERRRGAA
jgi:sec-independent protein translocase protein TatC